MYREVSLTAGIDFFFSLQRFHRATHTSLFANSASSAHVVNSLAARISNCFHLHERDIFFPVVFLAIASVTTTGMHVVLDGRTGDACVCVHVHG